MAIAQQNRETSFSISTQLRGLHRPKNSVPKHRGDPELSVVIVKVVIHMVGAQPDPTFARELHMVLSVVGEVVVNISP